MKTIFIAICLIFLAVGACAYDVRDRFCQSNRLNISPTGKYLYVQFNDNTTVIIRADCVMDAGFAACPIYWVPTHSFYGPGSQPLQSRFSPDDKYLYYLTRDLQPDSGSPPLFHISGIAGVDRANLDDLLAGKPTVGILPTKIKIPNTDLYRYLDLYPEFGAKKSVSDFYQYAGDIYKKIYALHKDLPFWPKRDIYGAVFDHSYIFIKIDEKYNAYLYTNNIEKKFFTEDGMSYFNILGSWFDESDYPEFKRYNTDTYILTSGSIISVAPSGEWRNITPQEPRVAFIQGDKPESYYGYVTQNGVRAVGVTASLQNAIQQLREQHKGSVLTGLSINNDSNSFALTLKQTVNTSDHPGPHLFSHYMYKNGKVVAMPCEGAPNYTFRQTHVGGKNGLWINSYILNPSFKTIVYLHGGPQSSDDVNEAGEIDGLRYIFAAGFNLDIVHYGGTRFTYNLVNRLKRLGYKSFETDVKNIESYVRKTYAPKQADLLLESFGGQYYRYFTQDGLEHFDKVVLNLPFGSYEVNEPQYERNRKNKEVGDEIFNNGYGNKFYDTLSSCPLKTPTFILVGRKDDRVNPLYDYRYCYGDPKLTLYIDDAGHIPNLYQMDIAGQRRDAIVNYFLGK